MMIFLRILLLALLVIVSAGFGLLVGMWYLGGTVVIPLSMILFGSISGKAAEDFCNKCCETERGEKVARLFYIFYNYGHSFTESSETKKYFELSIEDSKSVARNLHIIKRLTQGDAK